MARNCGHSRLYVLFNISSFAFRQTFDLLPHKQLWQYAADPKRYRTGIDPEIAGTLRNAQA